MRHGFPHPISAIRSMRYNTTMKSVSVKRTWDLLSEERRKTCIPAIITYFKKQRNEEIGIIAAEEFLDFILQLVVGDLYNKGVKDAKEALKKRFGDLEIDLDVLLKAS